MKILSYRISFVEIIWKMLKIGLYISMYIEQNFECIHFWRESGENAVLIICH